MAIPLNLALASPSIEQMDYPLMRSLLRCPPLADLGTFELGGVDQLVADSPETFMFGKPLSLASNQVGYCENIFSMDPSLRGTVEGVNGMCHLDLLDENSSCLGTSQRGNGRVVAAILGDALPTVVSSAGGWLLL